MRASLGAACVLFVLPAAAADASLKPVFRQAYAQTRTALLDVHLLLSSSQARLKRLEWAFSGRAAPRRRAQEAYQALSDRLAAFRPLSEAADAGSPSAPRERALKDSPEVRAAARVPASQSEQASEILALRAAYDAALSRKALKSAQALTAVLERRLGRPELLASQARALALAREAAAGTAAAARELRSSADDAKARDAVSGLLADCEALQVELERLILHYRLSNAHDQDPTLL
ncbi:MAG TPA: hypothetical protein DCM05_17835 [Elusimicrobia bacterium]|nr:hypothetical protein [Elusimicrobiota bacterium]